MDSETASSVDEQVGGSKGVDATGKHRIQAELKRVEQESRFLEVCSFSKFFRFTYSLSIFLGSCSCFLNIWAY